MRRQLAFVVALAASVTACSERSPEQGTGTVDPRDPAHRWDPVSVRPGYYQAETLPIILLSDGDPAMVRFASQGGYAMFAGARVSGLDPGPAHVEAELVSPEGGEPLVSDLRAVQLIQTADGSGDVEPDFNKSSNFAHLVPCPNYGPRPVHGLEWVLTVKVSDAAASDHSGEASVRVIPTCKPGSRFLTCVCECEPNYVFAKCGAPH